MCKRIFFWIEKMMKIEEDVDPTVPVTKDPSLLTCGHDREIQSPE
jgi:hypothetical protein